MRFAFPLALSIVLAGCPERLVPPEDGGGDARMASDGGGEDTPSGPDGGDDAGGGDLDTGLVDAGTDDAGEGDAGTGDDAGTIADAGPGTDGGMVMPGTTTPTTPPTVTRTGTGGVLLRGLVLTPSGPLTGEVLVVGNTITCVAADCSTSPMAGTVAVIDTHGAVISPGLIDGHNHLTYDFLPTWTPTPPTLFLSRYQWRGRMDYGDFTDPEGDSNNDGAQDNGSVCPGGKWGELRSLIHGTTTIQGGLPSAGIGCFDRLARNADAYPGTEPDFARGTISGPCESAFQDTTPNFRANLIADFRDGDARRFYVHVGEGYAPAGTPGSSTDPTREHDCFAGRTLTPTRENLFFDTDAAMTPFGSGVFIHAMPLTPTQLDEAARALIHFVWSPTSNLVLYGRTAPIEEMMDRGLVVGLGPDWTLAGSDEMLTEMRAAYDYGQTMAISDLTPRRVWEMATMDGAEVVGMDTHIGRIEVGLRADLVVFGRTGTDPYQAVLDSRAEDVRLVLLDGVGYYGDLPLEMATAVNGMCDTIDACGTEKYLCVANTPGSATRMGDTLASLETELTGILSAHGRTDLEPLIDCSR